MIFFIFYILFAVSALTFLVPTILQTFVYKPQDLKKKYNKASWALVTGCSTGIGRSIASKLAKQGFNILLVAFPDKHLEELTEILSEKYPLQKFIRCPVDLSNPANYSTIEETIDSNQLEIDVLFNNAGYITIGLFSKLERERQVKNFNVNSLAALEITHIVSSRMIKRNAKGCIVFTSSPVCYMPCPTSTIYGATKAFLTNFASSIAAELAPFGIDVTVVHPSPVDTNFYTSNDSLKNSSSLDFFRTTAQSPDQLVEKIFAQIGRPFSTVFDQGYFSNGVRLLVKLIDPVFLSYLTTIFISTNGDYRKLKKMD